MGDVEKETGKIINIKHLSDDLKIKSNKYLFYKDDILYGKLNPYLKKVLVAPSNGVCTTEFIPINLYGFCSSILYSLILKSSYVSALVDKASYGATLPRVKPNFISRLIVPLPPEQEQKRIVKQIELIFKELE